MEKVRRNFDNTVFIKYFCYVFKNMGIMADIKSKIIKQIEDLDNDTLAKLQGIIQNLLICFR